MSLRIFHVLFIVLSIALSAVAGARFVQQFRAGGGAAPLAMAVVFFLFGLALVLYGVRYFRKLKELS